MIKKKYFKCRDGSLYTKYTKKEICDLIDPYNFDMVKPFLKDMDYPAIYNTYISLLNSEKNPKNTFQRYINTMNLKAYRVWGYQDWLNYH